jgi:heme exporter protein B
MSAIAALLRKDLRLEWRARESVPAMALFSVSCFVLFHFALDRETVEGDVAAGVLWVTLLFAAILGINRLFVGEREEGGFDGFRLSPAEPTAMLWAKAAALFVFLSAVELVAVPAFVLLLLGPSLPAGLLAVLVLANVAIAVTGTLVSALAIQTRARDLIVPLIGLPLLLPAMIAAAQASAPVLLEAGAEGLSGRWLGVLALYDAVSGLLAWAVFDFLLED